MRHKKRIIIVAISGCCLFSIACCYGVREYNDRHAGDRIEEAFSTEQFESDTVYRNSTETMRRDAHLVREAWENTVIPMQENVRASAVSALIETYVDRRNSHFARAAASETALQYSGDTADLNINYHAIMDVIGDSTEDLGLRGRGIDILVKFNYLPAAEFIENIALDENNLGVLRRIAACVVWKIDSSRYLALPDIVFDKFGDRNVRLGWLQGTDYIHLSSSDVARLQKYLRDEGQTGDRTTTVRIRNILEKYR